MHVRYTAEPRPDTGVSNGQLAIWLFLASELMLFGSLFSSYALLRTGAETWPDQSALLNVPLGAINTLLLLLSSVAIARGRLTTTLILGVAFLAIKSYEYWDKLAAGLTPATSNFLGLYFVTTGLHAAHLLGGLGAVVWLLGPGRSLRHRVPVTALYWHFVDVIWIVIFVLFYLL
jgi:heme/copper-type cytochrome/quinol oxidase subunit 3